MKTEFSISKETNELLNILSDLTKIDEKIFTWLQDNWGEESPQFEALNEKRFKLFDNYESFILEQVGIRISDNLKQVNASKI